MWQQLLEYFSGNLQSTALKAYVATLAAYRPLLGVLLGAWAANWALDLALRSSHSMAEELTQGAKHLIVCAYLLDPRVPMLFLQMLAVPNVAGQQIVKALGQAGASYAPGPLLDQVTERVVQVVTDNMSAFDPFSALLGIFVIGCFMLLAAVALYLLALSTLYSTMLLVLLPLGVVAYAWDYTRPLFHGLIRQAISLSLIPPMVFATLSIVLSPLQNRAEGLDTLDLQSALSFSMLCCVAGLLMLQMPSIVAGVAGGVGAPLPRLTFWRR